MRAPEAAPPSRDRSNVRFTTRARRESPKRRSPEHGKAADVVERHRRADNLEHLGQQAHVHAEGLGRLDRLMHALGRCPRRPRPRRDGRRAWTTLGRSGESAPVRRAASGASAASGTVPTSSAFAPCVVCSCVSRRRATCASPTSRQRSGGGELPGGGPPYQPQQDRQHGQCHQGHRHHLRTERRGQHAL